MLVGIVDDELFYLNLLKNKMVSYLNDNDTIKTFDNYKSFEEALNNHEEFDLLFLDIELGEKNGVDIGLEVNELTPYTQIIYVTSHIEYVCDVYKTQHTFLIDKERIEKYFDVAVKQAIENVNHIKAQSLSISWNKLKTDIYQRDIIYIERKLKVSYIHTSKEVYKTSMRIDELFSLLNDSFCVCHKSFIVHMNYIKDIRKNTIKLFDDQELPISRSQNKKLRENYNYFIADINVN